MHRFPIIVAAVSGALLGPAVAIADAPGSVQLTPNTVNAMSKLHVDVDASAADFGGRFPDSVVAAVQQGFILDPLAVKDRCTPAQAAAIACPATARIAHGQAVIAANGLGQFTASVDAYLAQAPVAGSIAGVVVEVNEPQSNTHKAVTGSVRKGSGAFGYELRFEHLTQALPTLPPGVTLQLQRLSFDAGATRSVKTKIKKKGKKKTVSVKHSLITNPKVCPAGGWTARITAGFLDGSSVVRDYAAPCRG